MQNEDLRAMRHSFPEMLKHPGKKPSFPLYKCCPNEESVLRLIGALLAEFQEEWQCRKYLNMVEYHEWRAQRAADEKEKSVGVMTED